MKYAALLIALLMLSCKKKAEESVHAQDKEFEMYQMSEMASLMEQMYVDHQRARANILKSRAIGSFPEHFYNIRSAKFTDESDNDAFFRENAERYLSAEKTLFGNPQKATFNQAVDACMHCHGQKCGGPVTRIKKLYIP